MNDSTIAFRAKERIPLGEAEPPKAVARGVLSSVMRAINDDSEKCHAVEKRLSRNVADETVGDEIDKAILAAGAKFVKDDTLILVDPTEIRKEFGLKMEHVTMIRDASRSSKEGRDVHVHGYHGCLLWTFPTLKGLDYVISLGDELNKMTQTRVYQGANGPLSYPLVIQPGKSQLANQIFKLKKLSGIVFLDIPRPFRTEIQRDHPDRTRPRRFIIRPTLWPSKFS